MIVKRENLSETFFVISKIEIHKFYKMFKYICIKSKCGIYISKYENLTEDNIEIVRRNFYVQLLCEPRL